MRLKSVLLVFLGTLTFMLPAFYNGFPLVFSDTGMYVMSGMELFVPVDRPITYGLLLRLWSFLGLWGVVIFQSLCLAYTLWLVCAHLLDTNADRFYPIISVFLASTGAAAWYSSQLMPDIFSAILVLCVFLTLNSKRFSVSDIPVFAILWLSALVHYSHILLLIALFLVVVLWHLLAKQKAFPVRSILALGAVTLLASLSLALLNLQLDGRFGWSKGGHVFIVGRMIDTGIAQQYLEDHCDDKDLIWCEYASELPTDSRALLWDPESPLSDMGGWEGSKAANTQLIDSVIKDPGSWLPLLGYGLQGTISQLTQNDVGSGLMTDWYSKPGSPPYDHIKTHFPGQMNQYLQSRQNGNLWDQDLNLTGFNMANYILIVGSVLMLLFLRLSFWWEHLSSTLRLAITVVLLGIVVNAAITGGLANIYDRLQARVSWLIVFLAIAAFVEMRQLIRLSKAAVD